MLNLSLTTDKLQVISGSTATLDVHTSWVDLDTSTGTATPDKTNTAISTATTTDIVAAPASGKVRNVKTIHIYNKDAAVSEDVTVQFNQNATLFVLRKATLTPGDALDYIEGIGWFYSAAAVFPISRVKLTANLASTTVTTLADSTGLGFPVKAGKYYRFQFYVLHQAAATTTGIKVAVTCPAVNQMAAVTFLPTSTVDSISSLFYGFITSSGDAVTGTGTPVAAQTNLAIVEGLIFPSADGTLQHQHASEVAASGVTVMAGSVGILEQWL